MEEGAEPGGWDPGKTQASRIVSTSSRVSEPPWTWSNCLASQMGKLRPKENGEQLRQKGNDREVQEAEICMKTSIQP